MKKLLTVLSGSCLVFLFLSIPSFASQSSAVNFDDLVRQADEARQAGELVDAVDLYQQALEIRPEWQEGLWYAATLLYDLDQYAEARDLFRKLTVVAPENGTVYAFLGLCEFQTREYERALLDLQKARLLGLGGNKQLTAVARFHAGILLNRFEQFESAFETLKWFAYEDVRNTSIIEAMGISTLRMAYLPAEVPPDRREIVLMAGRATYELAGLKFDAAERLYQELLDRYPQEPNAHYAYGAFLMRDRREQGLEHFERTLELDPLHVPALLQIAFEYIERGEFESARPYAERAIEQQDDSFAAHNAMGRILLETGDAEGAIVELERAVELEPENPETRFTLSRAYMRAGMKEKAEQEREIFKELSEKEEKIKRGLRGEESIVGDGPSSQ